MAQRILVLGASGYIGQHLVFALSQQGHQVRAAARRVERLEKQRLANVSCHKVDLHWPENLPALLRDIDTVYYLVHGMGEGGDFIAHERQAALNVRDALRQTPVKQLISSVHCRRQSMSNPITCAPASLRLTRCATQACR